MDQALQNNQAQFDRICQKMKRLLAKKQNLTQSTPQEVVPGIFIANYTFSINKKFLATNNIGFIVTCVKIDDKDRVKGINYKQLLIKDKPDEKIIQYFDQVSLIISSYLANGSGRKCLINCFSGKSRSPSLIISYLINSKKISFQQAYQIIRKKYPIAQPNSGFISQLKQYEKKFKVEEMKQQKRRQTQTPPESKIQEKQQIKENYQINNKIQQNNQDQRLKLQEKDLKDHKNEKTQELILNQQNKQQIITIDPIQPIQIIHTNQKGLNNQGDQNENFQLLEGQKIEQKISSQNSAQQPPTLPTEQQNVSQNIKIVAQKQKQQSKQENNESNLIQSQILQEKDQQKQKEYLNSEVIQSLAVKDQIQETKNEKVQRQQQHKQEKNQGYQKQQNKSENQQKSEVVTTSQPRKKKKKHKKKKNQF